MAQARLLGKPEAELCTSRSFGLECDHWVPKCAVEVRKPLLRAHPVRSSLLLLQHMMHVIKRIRVDVESKLHEARSPALGQGHWISKSTVSKE